MNYGILRTADGTISSFFRPFPLCQTSGESPLLKAGY